jgi:hypothetical protein
MEVLNEASELISEWLFKIALQSFGIKLRPRQRKRYAHALVLIISIFLIGGFIYTLDYFLYARSGTASVQIDFQSVKDNKKMGRKRQVDFSQRKPDEEETYQYNWPDRITEGSKVLRIACSLTLKDPSEEASSEPSTKENEAPVKIDVPEHTRRILVPEPPNPPDRCYVQPIIESY